MLGSLACDTNKVPTDERTSDTGLATDEDTVADADADADTDADADADADSAYRKECCFDDPRALLWLAPEMCAALASAWTVATPLINALALASP